MPRLVEPLVIPLLIYPPLLESAAPGITLTTFPLLSVITYFNLLSIALVVVSIDIVGIPVLESRNTPPLLLVSIVGSYTAAGIFEVT